MCRVSSTIQGGEMMKKKKYGSLEKEGYFRSIPLPHSRRKIYGRGIGKAQKRTNLREGGRSGCLKAVSG